MHAKVVACKVYLTIGTCHAMRPLIIGALTDKPRATDGLYQAGSMPVLPLNETAAPLRPK